MDEHADIGQIRSLLQEIHDLAVELENRYADDLAGVRPEHAEGARNLIHYLAFRNAETQQLRNFLRRLGLYSLAHAERHVLRSIEAVQRALDALAGERIDDVQMLTESLHAESPNANAQCRAILGPNPDGRDVSIMVTLPTEAADNRVLVEEMLAAGMNLARINCAHDDEVVWRRMIDNVRSAAVDADTECRIVMDLAGPKLRTGELEPGPRVIHIRPKRDPMGRVIAPRRIRLIPEDVIQRGSKAAVLTVPQECIDLAQVDDQVRLRDTRGKKRRLTVVEKDDKGIVLESYQGAYIATDTKFQLLREGLGEKLEYRVGELPAVEQPLLLHVGDTLIIHADNRPGEPARQDADGIIVEPAHIACQQPEVFEFLSPGEKISLNDGKIQGRIQNVSEEKIEVEITKAKPTGSRLRAHRSMNFPQSDIELPGLTSIDHTNLEFIARHADAVNLSFVRKPGDVELLLVELDRLGANRLGLVIKVETKKGFKNLPNIILAAMRRYPIAVMIARGDLAVEAGWVRLAELQEEILWICDAARIPVMWATQVLEQETKKGLPSRAEITDAAESQRADCVMLNKGPHILAAIRTLDSILRRMQTLRRRKTA
ncbi:MAG TPA: pyruvate kinase [Woeseiaceae bacterium]|jgi:pyruvate kinase|nr:pyruvate kinase [Woeseiaceae bacterium]